jgi:hypothetical protein
MKAMKVKIIDYVTDAGHRVNEDVWGNTSSALWVIDGASSVDGTSYFSPESDARWLADIADAQFRGVLAGESGAPRLNKAIESAAQTIGAAMRAQSVNGEYTPPSAAVTMAEVIDGELYYKSLGDVTLAVIGTHYSFVEENLRALQSEMNWLSRAGSSRTGSRPATSDPAIAQEIVNRRRTKMNRPGGYWILSDRPEAAHHARSGHTSICADDSILIASDGFSRLVTTFRAYKDWREIVETAQTSSLSILLKKLRELEENDRERKQFPRITVKDDATAVLAKVIS